MTNTTLPQAAREVIDFWQAAGPSKWFTKDPVFDEQFRDRCLSLHMQAAARQLDAWSASAEGCLALMILLDQFPRNAFRGTAHMFATDPLALYFARQAHTKGFQAQLDRSLQVFLALPFEHSEDLHDQLLAVELCRTLDARTFEFAEIHRDVIQQFGRFPHRNAALGRQTTAEEQAFLDQGGFGG